VTVALRAARRGRRRRFIRPAGRERVWVALR